MKINKIIIVEPSPIICAGISSFINDMNQFSIVSVLNNMDDINDKMLVHNPDMLIINPLVFGITNIGFIKNLAHNFPNTIFIALITTFVDRSILKYLKETIELSDSKQKLVTKLINIFNSTEDNTNSSESVELSNREVDVLICVAKGMTNKDISEKLNISVHTVISHRKNIIKKTGIKSVSGLTVYALLNNMVEESEIYE